jgi:hypothetical protein
MNRPPPLRPLTPIEQARLEFQREQFDAAVEAEKVRLRVHAGRPWWRRAINRLPFTVTITRNRT